MAVEIISTLGQKNNGEFGIVDSNDIIGGFYQADTLEERDSIPSMRRKEGMFCWVGGTVKKVFQLVDGITNDNWIEFKSGGTIDGYSHIWVGDTPPKDTNMLWLDTRTDGILDDETDIDTVNKLITKINELETTIALLTKRVIALESGIIVTPPSIEENILLLEDGTELLLEDGSYILLENSNSSTPSNGIISSYDSITKTLTLTYDNISVENETLKITNNNSSVSNETLKL